MRVGIVGASNCILAGNFVDIIRQSELVTCADNMSLGGSTSVILPYAHLTHDLSQYDLIIFDFMINEYSATKTGRHTMALGMKLMRTFIGDLHSQGISTVFTIMPHKQALAQDEYDYLALFGDAAQKLGCHVIDATQAAMAALMRGISPDHLWQDETHISPALQRIIARRVLSHIAMLKQHKAFQAGAATPQKARLREKRAQAADFMPNGSPYAETTHRSSLCHPTYLHLPVGKPISFHAPLGCVYGIAYNSIKFAGDVTIASEHETAHVVLHDADVETLTNKPGFDFRHRVVPFAPVRAPGGTALTGEITLTPSTDCPALFAEVECIYGGPLVALPVPNNEGYLEDAAELDLLGDRITQSAA